MGVISDDVQVVQGSLGSGKSLVAVLESIYQLKAGGVVACNFTFTDQWAWELAGQDLRVMLGIRNRYDYACSLYSRCFKVGNPESMIKLSGDRGSNLARMCVGKRKGKREGKGLLVLDDCHHFFNARTYQANAGYVAFFANARKYGWRTILITHSVENIDKQIRSYIEIEARFRNLRKVRIPFTPFPVSPINAFLIVRRYYGLGAGSGLKHSSDLFFMDKRAAGLYDTLERFHSGDVLDDYKPQGLHPDEYVKASEIPTRKKRKKPTRKPTGAASPWPEYRQIVTPLKTPEMPLESISGSTHTDICLDL